MAEGADMGGMTGGISSMSGSQLGYEVGIKVLAKTNSIAKEQGQAVVSLLEDVAQMQDQLNAQPDNGLGGQLDIKA